jgi:hypothetical protein
VTLLAELSLGGAKVLGSSLYNVGIFGVFSLFNPYLSSNIHHL